MRESERVEILRDRLAEQEILSIPGFMPVADVSSVTEAA
jgi:hypothetical protein